MMIKTKRPKMKLLFPPYCYLTLTLPRLAMVNWSIRIEAASDLNRPLRSISFMVLKQTCLMLSKMVWHLVFGPKMWSLESSQRSMKSWKKWNSEKEQFCEHILLEQLSAPLLIALIETTNII